MATNVPSKVIDDNRQPKPYFCRSLIVICIAGSTLATVGWILGFFELVGPEVTGISLLLSIVLAIVWLLAILFNILRLFSKARWLFILLGTIVCWGSPILAWYIFISAPIRKMNDINWNPKTADEVRYVCHRVLIWKLDPHDAFLYLRYTGNETSVPYIIWAMHWMPSARVGRACTWGLGSEALSIITNQRVGNERSEWVKWYAANKHRTLPEWWADGFTSEGYPVSLEGGDPSIRNLLAVLGRTPWCQPCDSGWLSWNATRMLDLMNQKDIRRIVDELLQGGSIQERCGAASYMKKFDRAYAETILRKLVQDKERPVRLYASGMLSRLQQEWLKNPVGYIEKRLEPGTLNDEEFFNPPDKNVVSAKEGICSNIYLRRKDDPESIVEPVLANPAEPDKPICLIRVEFQKKEGWPISDVATVNVDGVSQTTGVTAYSKELISAYEADLLQWLYDSEDDSLYISVPDFTCKLDTKTGRVKWEMGFGTGNLDDISLIKGYLLINAGGDLVVCDADLGGILAQYDLPDEPRIFYNRVSLVDGRLRVKDIDKALYILNLPSKESNIHSKE